MLILLTILFLDLSACSKNNDYVNTPSTQKEFTDDLERNVLIPENITKIAVSGRIAQSIVFAISPDNLVAVAEDWSVYEKTIIDKKYLSLPTIGRIFGTTGLLNKEALLSLSPQIVIDIGQKQENIKEDFDSFEKELNIPIVHITLDSENLDEVYRKLGNLLSKQSEANTIISFIHSVKQYKEEVFSKTDKKNALFIMGKNANRVLQKGSYFSSSVDLCTNNIASFSTLDKNKYAITLTKEEMIKLSPDVIIFSSIVDKNDLSKNDAITNMSAYKNGNYYFFPHIPYENMGFAPGPGELFGTLWILKNLYENYISFNYEEEIHKFYSLFFHKNTFL